MSIDEDIRRPGIWTSMAIHGVLIKQVESSSAMVKLGSFISAMSQKQVSSIII